MFDELRILFPTHIYPEKHGGYYRTFNIAKLASEKFSKTRIFAVGENVEYEGESDGIYITQKKNYSNIVDKGIGDLKALCTKNYSIRMPNQTFYNKKDALFQIEGPFFYNLLKKKGIEEYILDEHNVYWELLTFPSFNLKNKFYKKLTFKRNKSIEIEALKNASHILVCSERDKQKILQEVPETKEKTTIIPNCMDFREYENYLRIKEVEKRKIGAFHVLFVGLLTYFPNIDAIDIICNKIAPDFDNNVQFIVIGKNPPHIKNKPDNVKFLGYVNDLKEYIFKSDVCIAPLRYGSGTRFKILEYMAMGKPVISTTKGVEGIEAIGNRDIIIEDNINMFSIRLKELLDDEEMAKKIGRNGMDITKRKYDWKIYRKTLLEIYADLKGE